MVSLELQNSKLMIFYVGCLYRWRFLAAYQTFGQYLLCKAGRFLYVNIHGLVLLDQGLWMQWSYLHKSYTLP